MSEVEKLYKNAGVEPTHYDACVLEDKYWNNEELANQYGTFDRYLSLECPNHGEGCYSTCEYAYDKDEYPPFTAEKQIELIKWLGKNKNGFGYFNDGATGLSCHCDFNWEWFDKDFYAEDFDNALAGLINNLWQDLTEEEKQQIKNILESEVRE